MVQRTVACDSGRPPPKQEPHVTFAAKGYARDGAYLSRSFVEVRLADSVEQVRPALEEQVVKPCDSEVATPKMGEEEPEPPP